jgi:hypothetical protein
MCSNIHFDGQIFTAVTSFASYCREKKMGKEPKCNGFICTYYNGLSLHDIRENAATASVAAKGFSGGSFGALNLPNHLSSQQRALLQSQGLVGRKGSGSRGGESPAQPGVCRACAYGRHEAHILGCPKRRARPSGPRKRKPPPSAEALKKAKEAAGGNEESVCKACLYGRHEAHKLGCVKRRPRQNRKGGQAQKGGIQQPQQTPLLVPAQPQLVQQSVDRQLMLQQQQQQLVLQQTQDQEMQLLIEQQQAQLAVQAQAAQQQQQAAAAAATPWMV